MQFCTFIFPFCFIILGSSKQLTIGKIYCVKLIILKYRRSKGKQMITVKKEVKKKDFFNKIINFLRHEGPHKELLDNKNKI